MRAVLAVLVLLAATVAGCVDPGGAALVVAGATGVEVVDAAGAPIPFAAVTAVGATGALRLLATGADGTFDPLLLPAGTTSVAVAATGHAPLVQPLPLPARLALAAAPQGVVAGDATAALRFLPPVDLGGGTDYAVGPGGATCRVNNCGLSEPVLEVAGDGTIYVSATCCIGKAPPVWASRDGGATFDELPSLYREATGIEGDFAVDDAGNVYFTDILVGALWFTSWDKDGKERWTLPLPFPPLVDRPWVRAGAPDVVYFAYNTGYDTLFYRSTDGGLTWGAPLYRTGAGLGDLGQGPENEHLFLVAGAPRALGDDPAPPSLRLHETRDGGGTWTEDEVPLPEGDGFVQDRRVPVADEAGNVWVVYAWGADGESAVYAVRRAADGTWDAPVRVSPAGGTHVLPWPAALKDGTLAVAWYGAPWATVKDGEVGEDDAWYLMVAATVDGASATPAFQHVLADPEPVAEGPLGRRLLDFLQIDVSPDGALHVAYAAQRTDAPERTLYVRSTTGLDFAPAAFPYGPTAGPEPSRELGSLPARAPVP